MEVFTRFDSKNEIIALFSRYGADFNKPLIFYTPFEYSYLGSRTYHVYIKFHFNFTGELLITIYFGKENEKPTRFLKRARIGVHSQYIQFNFSKGTYEGTSPEPDFRLFRSDVFGIKGVIDRFFGKRIGFMSGNDKYLFETLENIMREFREAGCIWKKVRK